MKYVIVVVLGALFLCSLSPWMLAISDLYWNIFTDTTLSGLPYHGSEGFARVIGVLFSTIPAGFFGVLLWALLQDLGNKR